MEALAADLSQAVTQGVQAVIESEGPVAERRLRVRSTEGSDRHWSMSFSPIHDEGGELRAVTLVGLDVTESRQIEEDLRRSEERYRSLVEAQSQLVWITTPTGTVAEDAPQWRAITGQGLEEYLAYGWLDVVHPDERPATEEAWKEALRGRTMFEWNYRVRTRASGYRHFEVRAVPIIRHGRVVEWVGANTDVTPQREAEEMRGRLTDQLGAAALRTARLQGATAQLAEALTVEQVVQVIIDVGRTALAADRSAVALLDTDRAALKLINGEGIPEASGSSGEEIPLSHSSVMTMAVNSRRPVFAESPVSLKMQLLEAERRRAGARPLPRQQRRAGLGGPAAAGRRAAPWARSGSRSPGRRRSPRRTASSWRRWPVSARWRWSGRRCSSASTAPPRRSSAACCPTTCRWSRAWSWPSGSVPAAATCRSAATGTTRSCCRTGGSRPSWATSWAKASRRRPGWAASATRCGRWR
ncbi:PAS domain-containing protein [Nonomuraea ferruginea]